MTFSSMEKSHQRKFFCRDNFFYKMGYSRPLFLYFRLFCKQLTVNKCSIKVADDWIQTRVLWYWKRPLCQLRHNHCPTTTKMLCILYFLSLSFYITHSYRSTISIPLYIHTYFCLHIDTHIHIY